MDSKMDNDQQQDETVWQFASCYAEKYGFLPPSQRREAVKRLSTRRRNPLTTEQCAQESPDVEAVLAQVWAAYQRKKQRSKASSAARRVSGVGEPEAALEDFSELSIEPEPAPEPEPEPTPEPLPAPLLPIQRATSQRPPPATPREPPTPGGKAQPQPRRSLFQAPAPATPVAAQPKKVAAGGLRAALMKRGA